MVEALFDKARKPFSSQSSNHHYTKAGNQTGADRLKATLNFTEADRVPFDLGGTTVSTMTKTAFMNAMRHRRLNETALSPIDVDPIQRVSG